MSSSSTKLQRRGGDRKTKGKILSSASIIGSNVDISTLILTRLPSKSLLVFKSVSKQWLSLITAPHFVHKHFIQNPKSSAVVSGVFFFRGCDLRTKKKLAYDYISLDGNTDSYYVPCETLNSKTQTLGISIVQSCNGLLLCKNNLCSLSDFAFHVVNPFTNKYKILPPSQIRSHHLDVNSVSLAFDPFKSPHYKVIAFWTTGSFNDYDYRIDIYDSETSSWRLSRFYSGSRIPWTSGIFCNGSLYWCLHLEESMICFDIDQESVRVVPLPISAKKHGWGKSHDIAEYKGHLYLIEKDLTEGPCFRIFKMDAANSGWNLKGQVDMRLNPYGKSQRANDGIIIFVDERGEEEDSTKVVLLTNERMLVSYDLKDASFGKICELSACQRFCFPIPFYQNTESLACV